MSSLLRSTLLVALATAFALALAYQVQSRVRVDIGGRWDMPFVARFFDAEGDTEQTYRWTRTQSRVELEGQNLAAPWTLSVRVNGYRPVGTVRVEAAMNDTVAGAFDAHDGWDVYTVAGKTAADRWSGDNTLLLSNDTFVPQKQIEGSTDARRLGVATDWVELVPARSDRFIGDDSYWLDLAGLPVTPPLGVILSWSLAFGMLYAASRGIGLPKRAVNIAFAVAIVGLALAFALARPWIGYYTDAFLVLALVLAVLAALLVPLLPRAARAMHLSLTRSALAALSAIVLLSFGLKWGGAWYPQFHSSDLLFHAHRLEFVAQGNLFFTSELPDAARRVVPYPPALYVALAPFLAFDRDYSALLVLFDVFADAVAILAIYFAVRLIFKQHTAATENADSSQGSLAALFAAFLFAFNPVAFWIYSWGNHTNILGQAASTLLFALLLTQAPTLWRNFMLMLFFFLLAALAHLGVFLSLLAFVPFVLLFRLFSRAQPARRETALLLLLFLAGVGLAVALYYSEFFNTLLPQTLSFLNDFGAGRATVSGGTSLTRTGDVARNTLEQLGWILILAGLAGAPLAWRIFPPRARAVWSAWLLVGVLFMLVTLGASFSTRYTLWAAPALALSGGILCAWLWTRSSILRWTALALCAVAFAETLSLWLDRIWNAYH